MPVAKLKFKEGSKVNLTTTEATPITMRLDERVIEQLKLKARRLSFETNKDVSYVDLIREALGLAYGIKADDTFTDLADFCIRDDANTRGFWTQEKIEEFEASLTGQMIAQCIKDDDYAPYVKLYKEKLKDWLHTRSLAWKLLEKTQGIKGQNHCQIDRDLASVAFVVSRRGAVPDCIMEGEQIAIPNFEICAHPTIRMSTIRPHLMFDVMVKPILAIQRELDSNVNNLLRASAETRADQVIESQSPNLYDIFQAFKHLAKHDLIPDRIIMHTDDYVMMRAFCSFSAPPLKEALEKRQYGSIEGVEIAISTRCEPGTIFVTPKPNTLGVLYVPSEPTVRHYSDSGKQREAFVPTLLCGLGISNDWGIAMIAPPGSLARAKEAKQTIERAKEYVAKNPK